MWWISHNKHGGWASSITPRPICTAFYIAGNAAIDPTSLPAYQAVAEYLMQLDRAEAIP